MFDFKEITCTTAEWDNLVSSYPGCTLFHTAFWADIIEKTYGLKSTLLEISLSGTPVGVVPIWITCRAGLKLLGSPLRQTATHFCGPLCNSDVNLNDVIDDLYVFASKELEVSYVDITLPHPLSRFPEKWNIETPDTFILDLARSEDEVWHSFEGRMRTAVRKAKKNGVEIKVVECNRETIKIFYTMLQEVHGRHGIQPIFPQLLYENLLLSPSPYTTLYGAWFENRWIAMSLILKFHNWLNYHSAASVRKFAKLGANNLLQWKVIYDGIREGRKYYDLGGGSGIIGIERFKKSMCPTKDKYQKMWRATFIAKMARIGYEKMLPWLRKLK